MDIKKLINMKLFLNVFSYIALGVGFYFLIFAVGIQLKGHSGALSPALVALSLFGFYFLLRFLIQKLVK
jgi:hypothetical protein